MHRFSFYFCSLFAAALYVSTAGCATPPNPVPAKAQAQPLAEVQPAPVLEQPAQSEPLLQARPLPEVDVQPLSPDQPSAQAPVVKRGPHIALLLPLKSESFGRAAESVRLGFMAAAASQLQALPIRVYSSTDESKEVISLYRQAITDGAVAVAGPLTRDGVTTLASRASISVPTLALNLVDSKGSDNLYFFGLSMEAEARQIAHQAMAAKLRYATIVNTGTPTAKRLSQAFADEWKTLGGSITEEIMFHDNPAELALLPTAPGDEPPPSSVPVAASGVDYIPPPTIAPGNMVFIAADLERARIIRPYLNAALPVYATSQVFNNNADTLTNYDLNDLHFVGMPWLLQPDHPAVMIYPRATPPLEAEMERLYALGIDAYRLLTIMIKGSYLTSLPLDGVTGRIHLSNKQFLRDAIPAQIKQGHSQISDAVVPQTLQPLFAPGRP